MKSPTLPHVLAAGLFLFGHHPMAGEAYVDAQNRLVVNGMVFTAPAISVDSMGRVTVGGEVFQIPQTALLEDGSLLLEGVLYPVPQLPFRGAASYGEWMEFFFPDPVDRGNPAISGPMADPGGLGVPNLVRYALAMHAANEVFDRMPRGSLAGSRLALSFPFIGERPDVRVKVVAGSDLVGWNEVLWDSAVDGASAEPGTWVEVADGTPLEATGDQRFLRLRISQPPVN